MNRRCLSPNLRALLLLLIGALIAATCEAADWRTNEVVLITGEDSVTPTQDRFRVVMLVAQIQKTDPEIWQVLDLYINADGKPDWQILSNRQKGHEDAANFVRIPVAVATADWDEKIQFTNKPFIYFE